MRSFPETFLDGFHSQHECSQMPYVEFIGLTVSKIGFGGSHMSSGVTFDETGRIPLSGHERHIETLIQALRSGINYIDTAPLYGGGRAEIVLGQALKRVPRSVYYLATKIGRDHECEFHFDRQSVLNTFQESLKRLDQPSVDILQVHDVEFADLDVVLEETLPVLEELRTSGKIKFISITSYDLDVLKKIIEKSKVRIDFVLSYCKNTMFNQTYQDYIPFFKERKLGLVNAGAVGMGLLTHNPPPNWHPASDQLKKTCKEAAQYCEAQGVDISRLALGFALRCKEIEICLVGNQTMQILKNNLDLVCNGLSAYEEKVLDQVMNKFFASERDANWNLVEFRRYKKNAQEFYQFLRIEFRK